MTKRSILAVTSQLPWPLNTGGHLRTYHMLHGLLEEFRVRLVVGVTPEEREQIEPLVDSGIDVRPAWIAPRQRAREAAGAVWAALQHEPYVLYRRHGWSAVRATLTAEIALDAPDVLYLDHLDSFQFADRTLASRTVIDLHNVYSLIVEREAAEPSRGALARRYLAREAALLRRVEADAVTHAGAVFCVSESERTHFAAIRGSRVHLVPNGVDCSRYAGLPTGRAKSRPSILFVGALSWPPNAAAARFLAVDLLQAVQRSIPGAALTIVGRDPGPEIQALAGIRGVTVAGNVPDIEPYFRDASLLAVPLAAGGGTRLKILEAFAAGLPVVSTPIGCEGIAAASGRDLLIAEGPAFGDAVAAVLADPARGERLAAQARALVCRLHDWHVISRTARHAINALVAQP